MKHSWNTLRIFLKFPWNTSELPWNTFEISIALPWNFFKTLDTSMKHPQTYLIPFISSLETVSKLLWSLLQTPLKIFLKHPQKFLETLLKQHTPDTPVTSLKQIKKILQHTWNFLKTPWKLHLISSKTSLNHLQNFFEILLKLTQNSLATPLKDSWSFLETPLKLLIHEIVWNILDSSLEHP